MSAPGATAILRVPAQRGKTTIAGRAVARMAEQAVAEVGQTTGAAGAAGELSAGIPAGRRPVAGNARASARTDGPLAVIEVRLSLAYPIPVCALTREVRSYVMDRINSLTGLEVRHVDIEVTRLLRGGKR